MQKIEGEITIEILGGIPEGIHGNFNNISKQISGRISCLRNSFLKTVGMLT